MEHKDAQLVVKVVSIIGYVFSAFAILGGLIMLFAGPWLLNYARAWIPGWLTPILTGLVIVGGIFIILFGVFGIFLYNNLWKYKEWARIVVLVFAAFGVLSGLTSLPGGIIGLLYNGCVFYFLGFEKTVTGLFKK